MSTYILLSIFWSTLFDCATAVLVTSPSQILARNYDFVVVGAGTAGNVVARRLTEDPAINVLLIEAGGSNEERVSLECPFLVTSLPGSAVDWNYTTVSQTGLQGRILNYTRGYVLGGSSSINYMTYNRGSNDIWNHWSRITGDSRWSWESVEEYYLKSSRLVPSADRHDTKGQVNPIYHGYGPVEVTAPNYPTILDNLVVGAAKQLSGRFSYNEDVNSGNPLGTAYMQTSIGGGERSSSATAYLNPISNRSNLDVLIDTHVTRLVRSSEDRDSGLVFRAVELAQSARGPRFQVQAQKEVVLSAGTIGTAHLLQLSGIGPRDALTAQGIPVYAALESVGQNLTDHAFLANYYYVNTNETYDAYERNSTLFNEALQSWLSSHAGPLTIPSGNTQIHLKLPINATAYRKYGDPSSGPHAANIHLLFGDEFGSIGTVFQPPVGNFMTVYTAVVSPLSCGSVKIASPDPFTHPIIDPAVYTNDYDIEAMVQAIRDVQTFLRASTWKEFVISPYGELANATTDESLAHYARKDSTTVYHPVGTARMSSYGASWGVVNPDLLVKGVTGLRIVDASVFPSIPETHTQASVYILAERAAGLIKECYGIL